MPKSRGRGGRRREGPSHRPPGPERTHDAGRPLRRTRLRRRLGWPLAVLGLVLFLAGNIGARTGVVLLPFDPHHLFAQFGGAIVAMIGVGWATSASRARR